MNIKYLLFVVCIVIIGCTNVKPEINSSPKKDTIISKKTNEPLKGQKHFYSRPFSTIGNLRNDSIMEARKTILNAAIRNQRNSDIDALLKQSQEQFNADYNALLKQAQKKMNADLNALLEKRNNQRNTDLNAIMWGKMKQRNSDSLLKRIHIPKPSYRQLKDECYNYIDVLENNGISDYEEPTREMNYRQLEELRDELEDLINENELDY